MAISEFKITDHITLSSSEAIDVDRQRYWFNYYGEVQTFTGSLPVEFGKGTIYTMRINGVVVSSPQTITDCDALSGELTNSGSTTYFDITADLPRYYTITYVTDYGSVSPRTVRATNTNPHLLVSADLPNINRPGFLLKGWFYDSGKTNKANIGDNVTDDLILYADWEYVGSPITTQLESVYFNNNEIKTVYFGHEMVFNKLIGTMYRELAYIESTSNAAGSFGIRVPSTGQTGLKLEMKVNMAPKSSQYYGGWFSGSGSNQQIGYADTWNGQLGSKWGSGTIQYWGDMDNFSNKDVTIAYNQSNGNCSISGTVKSIGTAAIGDSILFSQTYNMAEPSVVGKLKYFKLFKASDSSVLYYDMVPAQKKSDNTIGLYDKVNNKFYPNEGSGTFVAGDVVNENPSWSPMFGATASVNFTNHANVEGTLTIQVNNTTIPVAYDRVFSMKLDLGDTLKFISTTANTNPTQIILDDVTYDGTTGVTITQDVVGYYERVYSSGYKNRLVLSTNANTKVYRYNAIDGNYLQVYKTGSSTPLASNTSVTWTETTSSPNIKIVYHNQSYPADTSRIYLDGTLIRTSPDGGTITYYYAPANDVIYTNFDSHDGKNFYITTFKKTN